MTKIKEPLAIVLDRINETKKKRIKYLNITHFELDTIPLEIFHLTHLEELSLFGNKINNIPAEIGNLKNLKKLTIGHNLISQLPPEIGNLTNLERLFAYYNKLTTLPQEIDKLRKLSHIDLSNNELKSIPSVIKDLANLEYLDVEGNPLELPPIEIVNQGVKAVQNYLLSIDESKEKVLCNEAKLLIVGEGEVGKTCLMKKLMEPKSDINPQEIRTQGIDIKKWELSLNKTSNFKINFWDFGGQEILHATHQFFLTKRSLYLFVWNSRRDENLTAFDYWLNIIKLLSDNSPIIMVLNKIDINSPKSIDEEELQEKFNIVSFHKVSAFDGTGIDYLIKNIHNEIIKLPHIGVYLPKTWIEIRKKLNALNANYISYEKYLHICSEFQLDKPQAEFLRDYYHDLGIFLNFTDNNILSQIIFLKPEWATNAVYTLVENKSVQENHGFISNKDLKEKYWKDKYSQEELFFLIELMKKFELGFNISDDIFVIPELLNDKKPKLNWIHAKNLVIEYHYDFLPSGILTRLTARNHFLLKEEMYWKNGLTLALGESEALIICEPLDRKIKIRVKGNDSKEFSEYIRKEIEHIHKTLNDPNYKVMIPCICDECKDNLEPFLWDYAMLKKANERKRDKMMCEHSFQDVPIDKILNHSVTSITKLR